MVDPATGADALPAGDYLDGTDRPLRDALGDIVEGELHRRPAGRIRMLTHLRTWGWLFNPITVYWCDADDGTPDIVVLEVTNTPWGERTWYVVEAERGSGRGAVFPKALHVSPFLAMDLDYRFSSTAPTEEAGSPLTVRLEVLDHGRKVFDADLSLRRRDLTTRSALGVLVRHPAQTMRISAAIHWQALRLWAERVPVVRATPARRPPPPTGTVGRDRRLLAARTGPPARCIWKLLGRMASGRVTIDEDGGHRSSFGTASTRGLRPGRHLGARPGARPAHLSSGAAGWQRLAGPGLPRRGGGTSTT